MLQLEVLIRELGAVDGFPTCACGQSGNANDRSIRHTISIGEVATLDHELWDHTVESGTLITIALLASGQSSKVLGSLRNSLSVEANDDTAKFFITGSDIKVDLRTSQFLA